MVDIIFTEDISSGNLDVAASQARARAYTQAIADAAVQTATGTFKLPDTSTFTYTAYPASAPAQSSPAPGSSGGSNQILNSDITAAMQRGDIQRPGFYGNQELKESNDFFNTAINIGAQLLGVAAALKLAGPPPVNYVRSPRNYILTDLEKTSIRSKSAELSSFGVVPQDVLENFFYILAANESQSDLEYIANVIGIPDLGQPRYIRNIRDITQIQDIYKVGYLSNGIASITQRYAPQYTSMEQYGDYTRSSGGNILSAAALGVSLGVIGPSIIDTATVFNAHTGILKNAPSLSTSAINQSINLYSGLSSGVALAPTTISAILNPTATIQSQATLIASDAINSLLSATPLGGVLSSLGPLGGIAMGVLLQQVGGNAVGSFMSEVLTGQRIASSTIANNPMLTPPSMAGKSFFGEAPISLPAVDQVFCRKIGAFGTPTGGTGVVSFGMQNFASMGGALSIASVVSNLVSGSSAIPSPTTFYGQQVATMTSNLCNNMNVPITSMIEMRRSDNAIPLMLGMSAVMIGENFSPFGSKPMTQGWALASSTANDIQKYNPQYLNACRTSL